MNEERTPQGSRTAPAWMLLAVRVLLGWLILLFTLVMSLIGASVLLNTLGMRLEFSSVAFAGVAFVCLVVSITVAYFLSSKAHSKLGNRGYRLVAIVLAWLTVITLISFPAIYNFRI